MNDNEYTYICSRCGAEVKSSSRYCMKCGNLNYDHPANANMQKFSPKEQTYVVGSGETFGSSSNSNGLNIANNTGNKKFCFIVNLVLFFLINIISFAVSFNSVSTIKEILTTPFPILLASTSLIFLYLYSFEIMYTKMNQPWWGVWIPIYSNVLLCDALFKKKIYAILFFIPVVNGIFSLYCLYVLSKKFDFSFLIMFFLPFIGIPFIALSSKAFDGKNYVSPFENSLEKDYKMRKNFLTIMILFAVIGIGLYVYGNIEDVENKSKKLNSIYYNNLAKKIVEKTQKSVDSKSFECESEFYPSDGVYYFYYPSLSDEISVPLQVFSDDLSSYVVLEIRNGVQSYSVSITDGKNGFNLTSYDLLSGNEITEIDELERPIGTSCNIK